MEAKNKMNCPVCFPYNRGRLDKEGKCNSCSYQDMETVRRRIVDDMPRENRQEVLDLLLKEHLNVGDVGKRLGLDMMVVALIICDNIHEVSFLSEVAK